MASGSGDTELHMWETTSGNSKRMFIIRTGAHCVKFSPCGKYLAAGGDDKKIYIFDIVSSHIWLRLIGNTATVRSMQWRSDSKALVACCTDGTMRFYDFQKEEDG